MKRVIICVILAMVVQLAGCGKADGTGTGSAAVNSAIGSVKSFIKGDVTGELNKSYSTKWFDFTVKTIKTAYEYGEYETEEGYKFVIVTVSETNTFDSAIPMSAYDFYLDADGIIEEDSWPVEPFDDRMMPEEFELAVGESAEYDIVFVIPDDMHDIRFIYVEIDENDNVYATFTIKHSL